MLKGKVALITGGSRGIGKAIAIEMAKNGADVALVYFGNTAAAEEVVALAEVSNVKAKAYCCDVSNFDAVKSLVENIISDFGGIDIVVNNAGIIKDGLTLNMKEEDFDRVIGTNLKGTFNVIRHSYSHFMKKRKGRIINIASVSGLMGNAGQANYSSAKAGVVGLTKTIAKELASRNITCNAIAPGFIETDMTSGINEEIKLKATENIPLKKMGKPEDVASLAVFLASDSAGYITGEVIKVDGGLYI